MAVCPHGNMAATCHSCYPRLAEQGVAQVKVPISPDVSTGAQAEPRCPHNEPAALCLKCFPDRAA